MTDAPSLYAQVRAAVARHPLMSVDAACHLFPAARRDTVRVYVSHAKREIGAAQPKPGRLTDPESRSCRIFLSEEAAQRLTAKAAQARRTRTSLITEIIEMVVEDDLFAALEIE